MPLAPVRFGSLKIQSVREVSSAAQKATTPARLTALCTAVILAVTLLCACVNPARRADSLAMALGFRRDVLVGNGFHHVIYKNAALLATGAAHVDTLHIYIEGDGTPYLRPDTPASDPTPRNPVMLQLMALDAAPSIYLGRPCYFGTVHDEGCGPTLWTLRRYGAEVLDSMDAAVRAEIVQTDAAQLQIFGFSGGGTLAVLLAERLKMVARVVTIGANLDVAAWCDLHGYSRLAGFNPVERQATHAKLNVLHLVGERDTNTPPWLVEAAALARGGERVRVVKQFDHGCCWQRIWNDVLQDTP